MEFLWSPWRSQYVSSGQPNKPTNCVFCYFAFPPSEKPITEFDDAHYILYRGQYNFIILNLFPYTSAHSMVVPYSHVSEFVDLPKQVSDEMMDLAKQVQRAIGIEYKPDGYNMGMNLGAAAGAGIAAHLHLHLLPRWIGDANFMTTIGETRVLPEDLLGTYGKLKRHFQ